MTAVLAVSKSNIKLQKEQSSVKDAGVQLVQVQVQRDAPGRGEERWKVTYFPGIVSARGNFATRVFPKIYVRPCRRAV